MGQCEGRHFETKRKMPPNSNASARTLCLVAMLFIMLRYIPSKPTLLRVFFKILCIYLREPEIATEIARESTGAERRGRSRLPLSRDSDVGLDPRTLGP